MRPAAAGKMGTLGGHRPALRMAKGRSEAQGKRIVPGCSDGLLSAAKSHGWTGTFLRPTRAPTLPAPPRKETTASDRPLVMGGELQVENPAGNEIPRGAGLLVVAGKPKSSLDWATVGGCGHPPAAWGRMACGADVGGNGQSNREAGDCRPRAMWQSAGKRRLQEDKQLKQGEDQRALVEWGVLAGAPSRMSRGCGRHPRKVDAPR